MKLLVSKTCPFAQRAWIVTKALKLDCDIEIIDLKNKPEWFLKLTDFAKVPVLINDEQRVLWESFVVSNYLNELHGYTLSPDDRFASAVNEAWMEHAGLCQPWVYRITTAKNPSERRDAIQAYQKRLLPVENALTTSPYFNGEKFCLVDIKAPHDVATWPLIFRHQWVLPQNRAHRAPRLFLWNSPEYPLK